MIVPPFYAEHVLYDWIPRHRNELADKSLLQRILWALFGNDDDGIFGEGLHSGSKWRAKWGDEISFRRFVCWQIRNPLHNFMAYIIGFKGAVNVSYLQLAVISTKIVRCFERTKPSVFPMEDSTGVYLGLHNKRPFSSMRLNLGCGWLESYMGWRPNGGFGLACRLKHTLKTKKIRHVA